MVIYQHHVINNIKWYLLISPLQSLGGFIGRQYHYYFFVVQHTIIGKSNTLAGKNEMYLPELSWPPYSPPLGAAYRLLSGCWMPCPAAAPAYHTHGTPHG